MLARLRPRVREMIFTRAEGSRSKDPAELQALWPGSHVAASPREAIAFARDHFDARKLSSFAARSTSSVKFAPC